jgi:hypothetical protein
VGALVRPDLGVHLDPADAEVTADEVQAHVLLHFWLDQGIRFGRLIRALLGTDAWAAVLDRVLEWSRERVADPAELTWPTGPGVGRNENGVAALAPTSACEKGWKGTRPPGHNSGQHVDDTQTT